MARLMWHSLGRGGTALALCAALLATASCSDTVRQGRASSYLVIESLMAASGAVPGTLSGVLSSDVVTLVKDPNDVLVPTIFADPGSVVLHLDMKDPNITPTPTNSITITRYRVTFTRSDGRNTPGVDVPYPFDGAATGTVPSEGKVTIGFVLVRASAKEEAPLQALAGGGGAIHIATIADVTFYGRDQAGNEVTVTGKISVNFADWGDPAAAK